MAVIRDAVAFCLVAVSIGSLGCGADRASRTDSGAKGGSAGNQSPDAGSGAAGASSARGGTGGQAGASSTGAGGSSTDGGGSSTDTDGSSTGAGGSSTAGVGGGSAGTGIGTGGVSTAGTGGGGIGQAGASGGRAGSAAGGAGGARTDAGLADTPVRDGAADGNDGASDSGTSADAGAQSVFPPGVTKPRITIVGDSIAAGPGCYKKYLLMNLMANHYSKFEFVGEYADDCGGYVRHSAVSCSTTTQWVQPTFMMPNCSQGKTFAGMSTVVADVTPDLVMVQLGVNDVWGGTSTDAILKNYSTLIDEARSRNSRVVVVVAQIHKIAPGASSCNDVTVYNRAKELVAAVPAWAKSVSTAQSPVFTADLWTNSDQHQTVDCVHPDDAGAQRMGLNWFNALKGILPAN